MAGVKYIASCSFGKDSTAMILKLLEEAKPLDEVVFYDTGMEFQAIYHVRDVIVPKLLTRGIEYTELKPERPFRYDMTERPKVKRNGTFVKGDGWCGGPCRWGTFAKQRALNVHTKGSHVYLGIAFDEQRRLRFLEENKSSPLAEWHMTEADCLFYCRKKGISWEENGIDLYEILDRVSCWCCANKNRKELRNIYQFLPDYWERLIDLQDQIGKPMKHYRTDPVYGDLGDLRNLQKEFEGGMK